MTVGELKKLLVGANDDMLVLIPVSQEFDGMFYSPCSGESGVTKMGTDPDVTEEELQGMELLNKPLPEEESFMLVPHGFGEEKNYKHELN
jgi:hypothetical protein